MFHGLEPNDPIYPLLCKMNFRAIVTTNFDTLIEDAFQRYAPKRLKLGLKMILVKIYVRLKISFY